MATWPTLVETELDRAQKMTRRDHRQRWVTMDGRIHDAPVPYRDAISVCWVPISEIVVVNYRDALPRHPAIGAM